MLPMIVLIAALGAPTASDPFPLSESAAAALRVQAQKLNECALRDDDAGVVRLMYPKVVQSMGGRERARQRVEAVRLSMKRGGASLVSASIGRVRGCAKVRKQIQCVIEGTQIIRVSGGKLRSDTETLAFSEDGGKSWTFLSGGQDPQLLRNSLPELSANLPLRPRTQPVFERD